MVDARFPERWLLDRRLRRLPDRVYRTFTQTLVWSASSRTDGFLDTDDIESVPGAQMSDAVTLVEAGLWEVVGPGTWHIVEFDATQTTRSEHQVLENARRREREKKQRQRAKTSSGAAVPGDVPGGDGPEGMHRKEGRQEGRRAFEEEPGFAPIGDSVWQGYDR
jgi:hypothetical protein